ncbi:MAG TPA: MarR family transcriptional regulator [Gaiellales bacterium]|nr:MarR family transcriptional regulator [Gaiellales bacterium]
MSTRTMSKKAGLAAEVGQLLYDIGAQAKRATRPLVEEQGVTMPQALALHMLHGAGDRLTARDLGRECHMLASTITGVIDRLESAGHVRRERDQRDRRVVWISLTDAGRQLVDRLPTFSEQMGQLLGTLPAKELEQMRESLRRVLQAAERGAA